MVDWEQPVEPIEPITVLVTVYCTQIVEKVSTNDTLEPLIIAYEDFCYQLWESLSTLSTDHQKQLSTRFWTMLFILSTVPLEVLNDFYKELNHPWGCRDLYQL